LNELNEQQRSELAALERQKDEEIDLSDIAELTDARDAVVGKFFRRTEKPDGLD